MKIISLLLPVLCLAACSGENAETPNSASAPAAASSESAETPAARGRAAFNQCGVCHTIREGGASRVGPNLFGVYGRQAGALDDFAYSTAFQEADLVWDDAALDAFIENPSSFLPRNRMAYFGEANPETRADLIAFLKTLAPEEN